MTVVDIERDPIWTVSSDAGLYKILVEGNYTPKIMRDVRAELRYRIECKLAWRSRPPVCGHRSPLNYNWTRFATCTRPQGHDGDHRQGNLEWTDRTMPCRVNHP